MSLQFASISPLPYNHLSSSFLGFTPCDSRLAGILQSAQELTITEAGAFTIRLIFVNVNPEALQCSPLALKFHPPHHPQPVQPLRGGCSTFITALHPPRLCPPLSRPWRLYSEQLQHPAPLTHHPCSTQRSARSQRSHGQSPSYHSSSSFRRGNLCLHPEGQHAGCRPLHHKDHFQVFLWFESPKSLAAGCLTDLPDTIFVTNTAGATLSTFTAEIPLQPHSTFWYLAKATELPNLMHKAATSFQPKQLSMAAALAAAMAAEAYAPASGTTRPLRDCLYQIIT
mmetsp:Transcript_26359/g.71299  ORF Transcript_26359/g.71299 Transcript_26359/m.71299 type:complete len:283 (+) Transcript_26359:517-1365(+)